MNSDASTDRFLIAMGGFLGFGGAFLAALKGGGDDATGALMRACVAMLIGAGLMKFLIHIAHAVFRESRQEKKKLAAKAPAGEPAAKGAEPPAASAQAKPGA